MQGLTFTAALVLLSAAAVQGFYDPHCDGKQVIVEMFEWKWSDVAAECERFLGPAGYCGVQVNKYESNVSTAAFWDFISDFSTP